MLLHCLHIDQSVLALDSSPKRPPLFCTAYLAAREAPGPKRQPNLAYLSTSGHKLQGILITRPAAAGSRLTVASAGLQQLDTQTQDLPLVPTDKERQQDQSQVQCQNNGLEPLDSASASQRLTGEEHSHRCFCLYSCGGMAEAYLLLQTCAEAGSTRRHGACWARPPSSASAPQCRHCAVSWWPQCRYLSSLVSVLAW